MTSPVIGPSLLVICANTEIQNTRTEGGLRITPSGGGGGAYNAPIDLSSYES